MTLAACSPLSGCGGATGDEAAVPVSDAAADTGIGLEDSATMGTDAATPPVEDSGTPATDSGSPPPPPTDAGPAPNSVLVYTINIENMIFDWKDLIHVMERQPRNPDIVLIQQMTSKKRLDEFMAFMNTRLGENYDGVVAQDNPTDRRFQNEVSPNPTVTTGVIWRGKRFNLTKQEKWFPWGDRDGSGGHTCATRASHSGYQTIRVELDDVLAGKKVVATSLRHWTWMDCSEKNMIEMHKSTPDYALQIVGGDFNGPAFDSMDDYKCWYRVSNHALGGEACSGHANLGYADPLYEKCMGVKSCVSATSGIDFIFGRNKGGRAARTSGYDVITYDEGDAADKAVTGSDGLSNKVGVQGFNDVNSNYSEHRARRGTFYYE